MGFSSLSKMKDWTTADGGSDHTSIRSCYPVSMHPALMDLLERQRRDGFPDVAGSDLAATIPISDRLLTEFVATLLPDGGKVRAVQVTAQDGNRLTVKVKLSGPSLIPAIPVTLAIESQPEFPERPILGLRLAQASKFVSLAASALPAMVTLPPGISMNDDRIRIDFRALLAERGLEAWLPYLSGLQITTRAGAVVVHLRAAVPGSPPERRSP
jgi:hypothetical protein